jgi:hypothetical protein
MCGCTVSSRNPVSARVGIKRSCSIRPRSLDADARAQGGRATESRDSMPPLMGVSCLPMRYSRRVAGKRFGPKTRTSALPAK